MNDVAYDFGFRIAAMAVCVYSARKAWLGLVERKITFVNGDWLDWSRWSRQVFERDTTPVWYWLQVIGTGFGAVLCLVGAIIGSHPNN